MDNWLFAGTELGSLSQLDNFGQDFHKNNIKKDIKAEIKSKDIFKSTESHDLNHIEENDNEFEINQSNKPSLNNIDSFYKSIKINSLEQEEQHTSICNCGECCSHDSNSVEHDGHIHMFDENGDEFVVTAVPTNIEASIDSNSSEIVSSAAVGANGVPILSSNPNAKAKIYLDFDGHLAQNTSWNSYTNYDNIVSPAYSADSDTDSFNQTELNRIHEIWQRVAEDYAPFDVDVTTVEPSSFNSQEGLRVVIGGHSKDWFGSNAGGVAFVNSWQRSYDLPVYVFEDNLGASAKNVAEAVSHEVGHALGLRHQSLWVDGKKQTEYYKGSGSGATGWAPIMGSSYSKQLTTWSDGKNANGDAQGDIEIIASDKNGFGFKTDDHGNSRGDATLMAGGKIAQSGLITTTDDVDVFKFETGGGVVEFEVNVAQIGANLDVVAELWNSSGKVIASDNPIDKLEASINKTVNAGTYYLALMSNGEYGRLGEYSVSGTVPAASNNNLKESVTPDVSVAQVTVLEEEGIAEITVTLSEATDGVVSIDWQTSDDSAIAGSDYQSTSGQLEFAPGETVKTIEVKIIDDNQTESTEQLLVNLSNVQGANLLDTQSKVLIEDTDVAQPQNDMMGEFGQVKSINHRNQTITLEGNYTNPVVFAGPLSGNGSQTATVRITDIKSNQFSVEIAEPTNLDGTHINESFSYMVLEAGVWQLEDGTTVEVGTINTGANVGDDWANISYSGQFDTTPVILTDVQSSNNPEFIRTRQQKATANGVAVALEKEEALKYTDYSNETIGYLAIEGGSGSWSGHDYQASNADKLTHRWYDVDLGSNSFDSAPQFLGNISTYKGGDSSGLRYRNSNTESISLKIEEDTSKDSEQGHITEQIDWLAIQGSGSLEANAVMSADSVFTNGAFSADLSGDLAAAGITYSTLDF